ncbi:unnamed protein product [Cladocopium goreaui]|uniref:Acetyl-CoA carboxylase n=1 Tax=Cladocopium goreaui TaxID=2562237 RepID=A0A9P1BTV9_9DINO|nr:unnamed protein product [Cladocopium goreaui]
MGARWRFRNPGVAVAGTMSVWQGSAKVLPHSKALEEYLSSPNLSLGFDEKKEAIDDAKSPGRLHIIVLDSVDVDQVHQRLRAMEAKLRNFGAIEVVLVTPGSRAAVEPSYSHFSLRHGWREVTSSRDLGPAAPCLLEVEQLSEEFQLQRLPPVASTAELAHVFLGTPTKGSSMVVHACLACHSHMGLDPERNDWAVRLEGLLLDGMHELENAKLNPKVQGAEGRVYLHLTALADMDGSALFGLLEAFTREFAARHGALIQGLWVDEITIKVRLGSESAGCQGVLRFSITSGHEKYMKCTGMLEQVDPITGTPMKWQDLQTGQERAPVAADVALRAKRATARKAGSTYAPDFLGLLEAALVKAWGAGSLPKELLKASELALNVNGQLQELESRGTGAIGMLAWRLLLRTPEFPEGRSLVLIANDVTHQAGSFGVAEDHFFKKATEYARQRGLPRVYIACNSGARVGLVEEIMPKLRVHWNDAADPSKGFQYLYLTEADYKSLPSGAVIGKLVPGVGYALDAVVGQGLSSIQGGIGVENLQGSGSIAGETSRAYQDIFTLSYVTGRSVGIGAYLNRLGQRVIQSVDGPLVLTGYGALNKLLGKSVYFSQDQLGGPQIMVPNGITHQLVQNDQEGAEAILKWLSFVPRDTWSLPQSISSTDPLDRSVEFRPTKQPYDPRHMLAGTTTGNGKWLSGFFDRGSFVEYMAGWGRSVVVGRARLGGIPMGVIAVETRNVERRIPADPGNPESREIVEPQAGQVWFPDSAYKTATAIRDFNVGENLPLMIFANWRGFSGGTRDMYGEVLKFGAQIVDALVDYKQPVFIYIPPEGELRGGSWVVVDPAINPDVMEMYADQDSRGGILEPAGIVEVKFRSKQRVEMMHRLDDKLQQLDAQMKTSPAPEQLQQEIHRREEMLQPLYTQVACEFADLHDRAGRMKAVGAVRESLQWSQSRGYFYWRLKRRLLEDRMVKDLQAADDRLSRADARQLLSVASDVPDADAVERLQKTSMNQQIRQVHAQAVRRKFCQAYEDLEAAGEVTGLRRSLLRCLLPRTGAAPGVRDDVGEAKVVQREVRGAYPGLLGKEVPHKK